MERRRRKGGGIRKGPSGVLPVCSLLTWIILCFAFLQSDSFCQGRLCNCPRQLAGASEILNGFLFGCISGPELERSVSFVCPERCQYGLHLCILMGRNASSSSRPPFRLSPNLFFSPSSSLHFCLLFSPSLSLPAVLSVNGFAVMLAHVKCRLGNMGPWEKKKKKTLTAGCRHLSVFQTDWFLASLKKATASSREKAVGAQAETHVASSDV